MIDIFIAYAHNDLGYKNELKKFLAPLLREGRISVWDDFDIEAGDDWDAAIKQRLYAADLILLLVSADSLSSDYFYSREVEVSLERHHRGQAVVVPVILRHCDWEGTPLSRLEALPEKGRPVSEWTTRDQAFNDVVLRLRVVVKGIEEQRLLETVESEARRQFSAAIEAAEHLFNKEVWVEAERAYKVALSFYRDGFLPSYRVLEERQAACYTNSQAAETAQKIAKESALREQRVAAEVAYQREMEIAWDTAQKANSYEAYEHFLVKFPDSPNAKEARQKSKKLRRLGNKNIERSSLSLDNSQSSSGFPLVNFLTGVLLLLILTFLCLSQGLLLKILVVGVLVGWLAGVIRQGYGFGLIGNIVIGILGAFVGNWLFRQLGVSLGSGILSQVLTGAVGAVFLLFLIGLVKKS